MKWFRLYHDIIDDPKIGLMTESEQLLWVKILCLASMGDDRGKILMTDDEICFRLRISIEFWRCAKEKFRVKGLIDFESESVIAICKWDKHQYDSDSSTERTRKYRKRRKAQSKIEQNVTGTSQEQRCDALDTDTELDSDPETDLETTPFLQKGGVGEERKKPETFNQESEPPAHSDRTEPNPVQSNFAEPKTTEQGNYSAANFPQAKNKVEQFDALARGHRYPWNDALGRLNQEFIEFVGKGLPEGNMHPRVKARNHVINCENGQGDIKKIWEYWADYQNTLKESLEKEQLRQSAEIIPVAQPLPVYADDSTESLIARLKAKAKLPGQFAQAKAEALANNIPLEAIGLSEGAAS